MINEVIEELHCVATYIDDVIFFDPDPVAHILNITDFSSAY